MAHSSMLSGLQPPSKSDLLHACEHLSYNQRMELAGRIGHKYSKNARIDELITSLQSHPSPSIPAVETEEGLTELFPPQKRNVAKHYNEDQLALAMAVTSGRTGVLLTEFQSQSNMFKSYCAKHISRDGTIADDVILQLAKSMPPKPRRLLIHSCIQARRCGVLDGLVDVADKSEGLSLLVSFIHGCSPSVIRHHLGNPEIIGHPNLDMFYICRHSPQVIIQLIETDLKAATHFTGRDDVWTLWFTKLTTECIDELFHTCTRVSPHRSFCQALVELMVTWPVFALQVPLPNHLNIHEVTEIEARSGKYSSFFTLALPVKIQPLFHRMWQAEPETVSSWLVRELKTSEDQRIVVFIVVLALQGVSKMMSNKRVHFTFKLPIISRILELSTIESLCLERTSCDRFLIGSINQWLPSLSHMQISVVMNLLSNYFARLIPVGDVNVHPYLAMSLPALHQVQHASSGEVDVAVELTNSIDRYKHVSQVIMPIPSLDMVRERTPLAERRSPHVITQYRTNSLYQSWLCHYHTVVTSVLLIIRLTKSLIEGGKLMLAQRPVTMENMSCELIDVGRPVGSSEEILRRKTAGLETRLAHLSTLFDEIEAAYFQFACGDVERKNLNANCASLEQLRVDIEQTAVAFDVSEAISAAVYGKLNLMEIIIKEEDRISEIVSYWISVKEGVKSRNWFTGSTITGKLVKSKLYLLWKCVGLRIAANLKKAMFYDDAYPLANINELDGATKANMARLWCETCAYPVFRQEEDGITYTPNVGELIVMDVDGTELEVDKVNANNGSIGLRATASSLVYFHVCISVTVEGDYTFIDYHVPQCSMFQASAQEFVTPAVIKRLSLRKIVEDANFHSSYSVDIMARVCIAFAVDIQTQINQAKSKCGKMEEIGTTPESLINQLEDLSFEGISAKFDLLSSSLSKLHDMAMHYIDQDVSIAIAEQITNVFNIMQMSWQVLIPSDMSVRRRQIQPVTLNLCESSNLIIRQLVSMTMDIMEAFLRTGKDDVIARIKATLASSQSQLTQLALSTLSTYGGILQSRQINEFMIKKHVDNIDANYSLMESICCRMLSTWNWVSAQEGSAAYRQWNQTKNLDKEFTAFCNVWANKETCKNLKHTTADETVLAGLTSLVKKEALINRRWSWLEKFITETIPRVRQEQCLSASVCVKLWEMSRRLEAKVLAMQSSLMNKEISRLAGILPLLQSMLKVGLTESYTRTTRFAFSCAFNRLCNLSDREGELPKELLEIDGYRKSLIALCQSGLQGCRTIESSFMTMVLNRRAKDTNHPMVVDSKRDKDQVSMAFEDWLEVEAVDSAVSSNLSISKPMVICRDDSEGSEFAVMETVKLNTVGFCSVRQCKEETAGLIAKFLFPLWVRKRTDVDENLLMALSDMTLEEFLVYFSGVLPTISPIEENMGLIDGLFRQLGNNFSASSRSKWNEAFGLLPAQLSVPWISTATSIASNSQYPQQKLSIMRRCLSQELTDAMIGQNIFILTNLLKACLGRPDSRLNETQALVQDVVMRYVGPNSKIPESMSRSLLVFLDVRDNAARKMLTKAADSASVDQRMSALSTLCKASVNLPKIDIAEQVKRTLAFYVTKIKNEAVDNRQAALLIVASELEEDLFSHADNLQFVLQMLTDSLEVQDLDAAKIGITESSARSHPVLQHFLKISDEAIMLSARRFGSEDESKSETFASGTALFDFAAELQWKIMVHRAGEKGASERFDLSLPSQLLERMNLGDDGKAALMLLDNRVELKFVDALVAAYETRVLSRFPTFFATEMGRVLAPAFAVLGERSLNVSRLAAHAACLCAVLEDPAKHYQAIYRAQQADPLLITQSLMPNSNVWPEVRPMIVLEDASWKDDAFMREALGMGVFSEMKGRKIADMPVYFSKTITQRFALSINDTVTSCDRFLYYDSMNGCWVVTNALCVPARAEDTLIKTKANPGELPYDCAQDWVVCAASGRLMNAVLNPDDPASVLKSTRLMKKEPLIPCGSKLASFNAKMYLCSRTHQLFDRDLAFVLGGMASESSKLSQGVHDTMVIKLFSAFCKFVDYHSNICVLGQAFYQKSCAKLTNLIYTLFANHPDLTADSSALLNQLCKIASHRPLSASCQLEAGEVDESIRISIVTMLLAIVSQTKNSSIRCANTAYGTHPLDPPMSFVVMKSLFISEAACRTILACLVDRISSCNTAVPIDMLKKTGSIDYRILIQIRSIIDNLGIMWITVPELRRAMNLVLKHMDRYNVRDLEGLLEFDGIGDVTKMTGYRPARKVQSGMASRGRGRGRGMRGTGRGMRGLGRGRGGRGGRGRTIMPVQVPDLPFAGPWSFGIHMFQKILGYHTPSISSGPRHEMLQRANRTRPKQFKRQAWEWPVWDKIAECNQYVSIMMHSRECRLVLLRWLRQRTIYVDTRKEWLQARDACIQDLLGISASAVYLRIVRSHLVSFRQDLLSSEILFPTHPRLGPFFFSSLLAKQQEFSDGMATRMASIRNVRKANKEPDDTPVVTLATRKLWGSKLHSPLKLVEEASVESSFDKSYREFVEGPSESKQSKSKPATKPAAPNKAKKEKNKKKDSSGESKAMEIDVIPASKSVPDEYRIVRMDSENLFDLTLCYELHKLLPSQCEMLGKYLIHQAANIDRPMPDRVKALIRWTLLPTTSYADVVAYLDCNEKLSVNLVEAALKGIMENDEALAPLYYLLQPSFLSSDRARIVAFAITRAVPLLTADQYTRLLQAILSGDRRKSLKVTAFKSVIRMLAERPIKTHIKMIVREWKRDEVHRDVRIVILQSALRFLNFPIENPIASSGSWEILSSAGTLPALATDSEVLCVLACVYPILKVDIITQLKASLPNLLSSPTLTSLVKQLANISIPLIHASRYARDVVVPLCLRQDNLARLLEEKVELEEIKKRKKDDELLKRKRVAVEGSTGVVVSSSKDDDYEIISVEPSPTSSTSDMKLDTDHFSKTSKRMDDDIATLMTAFLPIWVETDAFEPISFVLRDVLCDMRDEYLTGENFDLQSLLMARWVHAVSLVKSIVLSMRMKSQPVNHQFADGIVQSLCDRIVEASHLIAEEILLLERMASVSDVNCLYRQAKLYALVQRANFLMQNLPSAGSLYPTQVRLPILSLGQRVAGAFRQLVCTKRASILLAVRSLDIETQEIISLVMEFCQFISHMDYYKFDMEVKEFVNEMKSRQEYWLSYSKPDLVKKALKGVMQELLGNRLFTDKVSGFKVLYALINEFPSAITSLEDSLWVWIRETLVESAKFINVVTSSVDNQVLFGSLPYIFAEVDNLASLVWKCWYAAGGNLKKVMMGRNVVIANNSYCRLIEQATSLLQPSTGIVSRLVSSISSLMSSKKDESKDSLQDQWLSLIVFRFCYRLLSNPKAQNTFEMCLVSSPHSCKKIFERALLYNCVTNSHDFHAMDLHQIVSDDNLKSAFEDMLSCLSTCFDQEVHQAIFSAISQVVDTTFTQTLAGDVNAGRIFHNVMLPSMLNRAGGFSSISFLPSAWFKIFTVLSDDYCREIVEQSKNSLPDCRRYFFARAWTPGLIEYSANLSKLILACTTLMSVSGPNGLDSNRSFLSDIDNKRSAQEVNVALICVNIVVQATNALEKMNNNHDGFSLSHLEDSCADVLSFLLVGVTDICKTLVGLLFRPCNIDVLRRFVQALLIAGEREQIVRRIALFPRLLHEVMSKGDLAASRITITAILDTLFAWRNGTNNDTYQLHYRRCLLKDLMSESQVVVVKHCKSSVPSIMNEIVMPLFDCGSEVRFDIIFIPPSHNGVLPSKSLSDMIIQIEQSLSSEQVVKSVHEETKQVVKSYLTLALREQQSGNEAGSRLQGCRSVIGHLLQTDVLMLYNCTVDVVIDGMDGFVWAVNDFLKLQGSLVEVGLVPGLLNQLANKVDASFAQRFDAPLRIRQISQGMLDCLDIRLTAPSTSSRHDGLADALCSSIGQCVLCLMKNHCSLFVSSVMTGTTQVRNIISALIETCAYGLLPYVNESYITSIINGLVACYINRSKFSAEVSVPGRKDSRKKPRFDTAVDGSDWCAEVDELCMSLLNNGSGPSSSPHVFITRLSIGAAILGQYPIFFKNQKDAVGAFCDDYFIGCQLAPSHVFVAVMTSNVSKYLALINSTVDQRVAEEQKTQSTSAAKKGGKSKSGMVVVDSPIEVKDFIAQSMIDEHKSESIWWIRRLMQISKQITTLPSNIGNPNLPTAILDGCVELLKNAAVFHVHSVPVDAVMSLKQRKQESKSEEKKEEKDASANETFVFDDDFHGLLLELCVGQVDALQLVERVVCEQASKVNHHNEHGNKMLKSITLPSEDADYCLTLFG